MYQLSGNIKKINVNFDQNVDTSFFNQSSYHKIKNDGLLLTDLSLIHYASVHYQSKFNNSLSRRYKYTLDTIEPSIINNNTHEFYFSGDEESELQKVTSEVVGVGFAIALSHNVLDVRVNRINRLPLNGGKKRCDFETIKENNRIIIESKGTKRDIGRAKNKINAQKQEYQNCIKYGIISHLPRDAGPAELYMVDPEIELEEINRDYTVIVLLTHYSKATRLAGFYRLSDKLNERIEQIRESENNTSRFDGIALDFGNVVKLGKSLSIQVGDSQFLSFFSPDKENGLKVFLKDNETILIYGIEEKIFDILDRQNYEELIEYEFKNIIDDKFSILDNGSFLIKESSVKLQEILRY